MLRGGGRRSGAGSGPGRCSDDMADAWYLLSGSTADLSRHATADLSRHATADLSRRATMDLSRMATADLSLPLPGKWPRRVPPVRILSPVNGRRTVPPGSAHSKRQLFHHLMSSPPPGGGQFGSKTSPDGGNVHKCATPHLVREIGRHRHPGDTGYIFKKEMIIILSLDLDSSSPRRTLVQLR